MTPPRGRAVPITPAHDLSQFRCTEQSLNEWLTLYALRNEEEGSSRTFVVCDERSPVVIAYYSLAASSLERCAVHRSVGQGSPDPVPAVLLGRLAVTREREGQELGAMLLGEALLRAAFPGTLHVGARAFAIEAKSPDVATWYTKKVPDLRRGKTDDLTLTIPLAKVRASVETPDDLERWLGPASEWSAPYR